MSSTRWTPGQIKLLRQHFKAGAADEALAKLMNDNGRTDCTVQAVRFQRHVQGLLRRKSRKGAKNTHRKASRVIVVPGGGSVVEAKPTTEEPAVTTNGHSATVTVKADGINISAKVNRKTALAIAGLVLDV